MTDTQRSKLRTLLLVVVPIIALAIGGVIWLFSGRYETTDNAYVKADKIMISPEVSGTILTRNAENNQIVTKDEVLFTIDARPFQIALEKAQADLGTTHAAIEDLKSQYRQKQAELGMRQSDIALADAQYERAVSLAKTNAMSKVQLDEATRDRDSAHANLDLTQRELDGLVAQLAGDPNIDPENHPTYKAAKAAADKARLDLTHTVVFAPADGIVGNVPNVGDYARASVPALSLVATSRVWVEANFKETQLEHIKPGQPVAVDVDSFPDRTWHGEVESVSGATGSEFSILPAQNATGNWVKVVQRLAVRIRITDQDAPQFLRPGMSAETKIDLQHRY